MHEIWTEKNISKTEVFYDKLRTRYWAGYVGDKRNYAARDISESIHATGSAFSGYMSQAAIDKKMSGELFDPTNEHFHSRQQSGHLLMEYFENNNPTFEEFKRFLEPLRFTHKTTKEENERLIRFQKDIANYPTWQEQYAAANICLEYVGTGHALTKKYLTTIMEKTEPFVAPRINKVV